MPEKYSYVTVQARRQYRFTYPALISVMYPTFSNNEVSDK